ncbi:MAG: helix-turn-helix domain-containing protein, partial [Dokdonella sp.]
TVDADAIHIRDGRLRTAAGVTAGLDLALALAEEDLGDRTESRRATGDVLQAVRRADAIQPQGRRGHGRPLALQQVQRWVAANPVADHSMMHLAERTGLSPRHFARLFRHEVGTTPAAWVEQARVSASRRLLESSQAPKQVAARCGFADADTLRRAFRALRRRDAGALPQKLRRPRGVSLAFGDGGNALTSTPHRETATRAAIRTGSARTAPAS